VKTFYLGLGNRLLKNGKQMWKGIFWVWPRDQHTAMV